ncbi:hypothetical protein BT69DRAFT_1347385, partial [Atractiella rhizophila]
MTFGIRSTTAPHVASSTVSTIPPPLLPQPRAALYPSPPPTLPDPKPLSPHKYDYSSTLHLLTHLSLKFHPAPRPLQLRRRCTFALMYHRHQTQRIAANARSKQTH